MNSNKTMMDIHICVQDCFDMDYFVGENTSETLMNIGSLFFILGAKQEDTQKKDNLVKHTLDGLFFLLASRIAFSIRL